MRKKPEISEEEKTLFRSAMRGVKSLTHTKVIVPPARTKKVVHYETKNTNPLNLYEDENPLMDVSGDERLDFHRPGLQHKVLRKFRRGQYNVEATLDMHGMRVIEARKALNDFLLDCLENDIRHVLIVHGKGRDKKPILKNALNQWLRQLKEVLAFCSAVHHGQGGAVYVLLKGGST